MVSEGNNLIGAIDGCDLLVVNSDQRGTAQAPLSPGLEVLAQLPPTYTEIHRLLPGSPAIGGGKPCVPNAGIATCYERDQRGFLRHTAEDGASDIGAYEYGAKVMGTGTLGPVVPGALSPASPDGEATKGPMVPAARD